MCAQWRLRSAWASAQSDKSSLCTQWVAKDTRFLHADSQDSDQAWRMPRLIWVIPGSTSYCWFCHVASHIRLTFWDHHFDMVCYFVTFIICVMICFLFLVPYWKAMIWATSWENLFLPYANNKGADQPAHPRSLISTFVVCCQDSIISLVFISKISNL